MKIRLLTVLFAIGLLLTPAACRKIASPAGAGTDADDIAGFFLLNEGNLGANKCTLDYYDYTQGIYFKNIFPERNPDVAWELGDAGNDLQIYGGRLYAVISASNLVEVMDAATARHIGQVKIPNCRYIVFEGAYAYVSAYACPIGVDPDSPLGYVAKIDTLTLEVVATCEVGYQPEEMVIAGGKLYVANSGVYRVPDYEHTVSVIDLESFEEIQKIDVAPNLHRMELDAYGNIWVSSRGDYYDILPMVYVISTEVDCVIQQMDHLPCSEMTLCGDSLYVLSNSWSNFTQTSEISYAIVNVKTRMVETRHLITDGTEDWYQNPYGLAVNPETREFFITDTRDSFTPGKLYCYSPEGRMKWSVYTGDIPSRIVFTQTPLQ